MITTRSVRRAGLNSVIVEVRRIDPLLLPRGHWVPRFVTYRQSWGRRSSQQLLQSTSADGAVTEERLRGDRPEQNKRKASDWPSKKQGCRARRQVSTANAAVSQPRFYRATHWRWKVPLVGFPRSVRWKVPSVGFPRSAHDPVHGRYMSRVSPVLGLVPVSLWWVWNKCWCAIYITSSFYRMIVVGMPRSPMNELAEQLPLIFSFGHPASHPHRETTPRGVILE